MKEIIYFELFMIFGILLTLTMFYVKFETFYYKSLMKDRFFINNKLSQIGYKINVYYSKVPVFCIEKIDTLELFSISSKHLFKCYHYLQNNNNKDKCLKTFQSYLKPFKEVA
jgi:hypothetical protein